MQQHRLPQEDESVEFSRNSSSRHGFDWVTRNYKGEDANNLAPKFPVSQQSIVKSSENFYWAAVEAIIVVTVPFVFLLQ